MTCAIMPAKAAKASYFCLVDVNRDLHMRSLFSSRRLMQPACHL